MQVELYGKRSSAASEEARAVLLRLRSEVPFDLIEIDVDLDEQLKRKFGDDVPVVYLDGRRVFRRGVDAPALLLALERGRSVAMGTPEPLHGEAVGRATKSLFAAAVVLGLCAVVGSTAARKLVFEPALEIRALEITPENFPAPAFSLLDGEGRAHSLGEARGKIVFLNFWASWCAPCREEMPAMARLAMQLEGHPDFVMLAVSVDDGWAPLQRYFSETFGSAPPPFPVLLDVGAKVSQAYGTVQFPESYVIDRSGKVIAKFVGARDWSTPAATRYLEGLLK